MYRIPPAVLDKKKNQKPKLIKLPKFVLKEKLKKKNYELQCKNN